MVLGRHGFPRRAKARHFSVLCTSTISEMLERRTLLAADTPDLSFGVDGQVVTDFSSFSGTKDVLTGVRSLSDGDTLAIGNDGGTISWIARYNPDGSLDAAFGDRGRVSTSLLQGASDVRVDGAGAIYLAGRVNIGFGNDMAVLKLTASGDIDESFGNGGLTTADFGAGDDEAASLVLQSDGRILIAGRAFNGFDFDFGVARFDTLGNLDNTYSLDGLQVIDFGGFDDVAEEVQLDSAGRAVVVGTSFTGFSNDFALARLSTQGSLDNTFDADGRVTTDFGSGLDDEAFSVEIGSTGLITVGGSAFRPDGFRDFALAQYNTNGSLRLGFDDDGRATTNFARGTPSDDQIREIRIDAQGRIVAAGVSREFGLNPRIDFALARYNANGGLESALGDGGRIYTTFFTNAFDEARALDLDAQGRWVVGGITGNDIENFALARYTPAAGALDVTFQGGQVVTDFTDGSLDFMTAVRSLPDGRTIAVGFDAFFDNSWVALYNSDGTLDTTFGIGGRVGVGVLRRANAVVVLQDGSILLAGNASDGFNQDLAVLKLTSRGVVDESFGNRGLATADFNPFDEGLSLAVQSDGRIIVAGRTFDGFSTDFAVARFDTLGILDTTYDGDGKQTVDFGGGFDTAQEVKLDGAGRAVLVGDTTQAASDFALARLSTQGSLDVTFDSDGRVTTDFGGGADDFAASLVISAAGIITVGGASAVAGGADFALAQYNSNGSLRLGFNGDGRTTTDFSQGTTTFDSIREIRLDAQDRIVAAGFSADTTGFLREDFALARYSANGALDSTLGDGGRITVTFDANLLDEGQALDLDAQGRWIVGGITGNLDFGARNLGNFALARLDGNGNLDPTFQGGQVVTDFTDLGGTTDILTAVRSLSDGKTVAVGHDAGSVSWIARYNADGSLDPQFGLGGRLATTLLQAANDVQVLADGSLLLAGRAFNGFDEDFAVLKLTSSGQIDENFGNRGLAVADFFGSDDVAKSLVVQADGRIVVGGAAATSSSLNTFFSGDVPQPITDNTTTSSLNFVGGLASIADVNVTLDITHTFDGDLRISLISPSGTEILLSNFQGGSGDDFANTTFDDESAFAIDEGFAPFAGTFRPEFPLSQLDGESPNGFWQLLVRDDAGGDVGTLNSWSLDIRTQQLDFGVARFDTLGILDNSYDADGKQTVDFAGSDDEAREVQLDASGRAVLAGVASDGVDRDFALTRLTTQGSIDNTFGGGRVTTDFEGFDDEAFSVEIDAAGVITAAGFAGTSDGATDFALAQYNSNGSLRLGFSGDGKATTDFARSGAPSADRISEIHLDSNGRIVAAGGALEFSAFNPRQDFAMARYSANGVLDDTLGDGGRVVASFFANEINDAQALDIDARGRWVVGGATGNVIENFALARFGNSPPEQTINQGLTLNEGATAAITSARLLATDPEQPASELTYQVTQLPARGQLRLNGSPVPVNGIFTQADIDANRVTYAHNGGETTSDAFQFTVDDGQGGVLPTATFAITVAAVNDLPVLTGISTPLTYVENAAALLLAPAATVIDADSTDFNAGTLTVKFNLGGQSTDRLLIRNQGTGAGQVGVSGSNVTFSGSTVGSFTGGVGAVQLVVTFNAAATPAVVEAVLRNITYRNLSDNPTDFGNSPSRTINYVLTDGDGGTSAGFNQTVNVTAVNDRSVLGDVTSPQAYSENAGAMLLAPAATVSDPDSATFNGGRLAVKYTAGGLGSDRLTIRNVGTGAGQIGVSGGTVTYGGTAIGSFTGGTGNTALVIQFNAASTRAAAQALLRNLLYQNVSDNPSNYGGSPSRTINYVLFDGANGVSLGVNQTLNVTAVNDNPTVGGVPSLQTYAENAALRLLTPSSTVVDPDSLDFSGGELLVQYVSGALSTDRLAIRHQGTGAGQVGVSGGTVTFGGVPVGTVTGGVGTAALRITFSAACTPLAAQAVLRNVQYQNVSDNPTNFGANPARDLRFRVQDGDGGSSGFLNQTLNITAANDASAVSSFADASTYTAGAAATILDADATLTDADSADLAGGNLVLQFTSGAVGTNRLTIRNQGTGANQIGVSGSNVTFAGTVIGTLNANGGVGLTALIVTFNSAATPAAAQALLRNLTYQSTVANPTGPKTLTLKVRDGDGGVTTVNKTLNIAPAFQAAPQSTAAFAAYSEWEHAL